MGKMFGLEGLVRLVFSRRRESMKKVLILAVVMLTATALAAHPHFQKTTSAKLTEDLEVSISFVTVPANMDHVANVANGEFVSPGLPKFETSSAITAGGADIPVGTYTVGVVKNGAENWTMVLSPGELAFGDSPDMSKLIELDSAFMKANDDTGHLVVDVFPGSGKFEGKAVILLGFGTMWVQGLVQ
jgi:hypothetical protein